MMVTQFVSTDHVPDPLRHYLTRLLAALAHMPAPRP
jgi:hypothetical protein